MSSRDACSPFCFSSLTGRVRHRPIAILGSRILEASEVSNNLSFSICQHFKSRSLSFCRCKRISHQSRTLITICSRFMLFICCRRANFAGVQLLACSNAYVEPESCSVTSSVLERLIRTWHTFRGSKCKWMISIKFDNKLQSNIATLDLLSSYSSSLLYLISFETIEIEENATFKHAYTLDFS